MKSGNDETGKHWDIKRTKNNNSLIFFLSLSNPGHTGSWKLILEMDSGKTEHKVETDPLNHMPVLYKQYRQVCLIK